MQPTSYGRIIGRIISPRIVSTFARPLLISALMLALIACGILTWRSAAAARAITLARSFAATPIAMMFDTPQPVIGPGLAQVGSSAPKSVASSTKAGSVLFFSKYTSDSSRPNVVNTLLTLSNTNPRDGVAISLYFVHDCGVDQKFINLAPNQTRTLLASKEGPNTTGYLIAVAVDSRGLPTQFNWLIGSATLHDALGHEANYNAVSVAKRTGNSVFPDEGNATATLSFDNVQYDRLPKLVAVDSLQNQSPEAGPAVNTDVTVYSPLADLSGTSSQSLQITAIAYDHNGRPYLETINAGCGLAANVGNIWTTPLNSFVTPGNPGWATFAAVNNNKAVPVLGLSLTDAASGAQRSGRNMQALAWLDSYNIKLPIRLPSTPPADMITLDLADATGGATGASELKAGSALLYSRFTSGNFGSTQINLTNTHPTQKVRVRVFFSGMANTPLMTETIITLLPNQTTTLNAQDIAPDQRGWVLALAIDSRALPLNFNYLIGSAQVSETDGQTAAFNALAIAKNSSGTVPRNSDVLTSDLLFDDVNYDRLPATIALSAAPSQADNATLLGYARPGVNLLEPPSTRGAALLALYNDSLDSASMLMGLTESRLGLLRPSLMSPPIANMIFKGHRGWLKLSSSSPLFGWANNLAGAPLVTTPEGDWTGGLSGGGNLHTLTTCDFLLKTAATNPDNHAPTAGAATIGVYIEARSPEGTIVRLDGSFSSDPDPDEVLTYKWYDNDRLVSTLPIADLRLSLGVHYIKLIVTDSNDIASTPDEQYVEVRDTTPPQISGVPSTITRTSGSLAGVMISFPSPVAYDSVSSSVSIKSSKLSGSLFPIGTTSVVFTAMDSAGNYSNARMDVIITKGGATLPAKGGIIGNVAPSMDNIHDQYIPAGQIRNIPLQATDADGDPITFSLISTTPSAHIVNVDPASRKATLQIALEASDLAVNTIRVVASDGRGQKFTTLPFRIATSDIPNDDTGNGGMSNGGGSGGGGNGGGGNGGGGNGGGGNGGGNGGDPPPNRPPVAVAAAVPATTQATSRDGATIHLNGSPSSDPDNEPLTYTWTEGTTVIAQGALVDIILPVGQHSVVLTVADPSGATSSTAPLSFEVLPRNLTVTFASPVRVSQFYTLDMTITGTGFNAGSKVSFSGTGITLVKYVSIEEDKIVVKIKTTQTTPLGNRDLYVTNPDGTFVKLGRAFYIAL